MLPKIFWGVNARTRKRIFDIFVKNVGFVYFGSVDQHMDDHKIIRGFTVSSSHRDSHYCVGSIGDYDVSVVDRTDSVWQPNGSENLVNWLIMAFELKTKVELPHFFLAAHNNDMKSYSTLFTTFPNITELKLGTFEDYDPEFTSRFSLFSAAAKAIEVEKLFPSKSTRVIAAHLWPLSVEQTDNILYVYADNAKVTTNLLDSMLKNGLWLAENLDIQAELV